ncbi:MAG: trigger factor [Verrucomicrobia bacterium]|nr:trigger factor [Verrucomicrobiota bacterium]
MNVTVEQLSPCKKLLRVELDAPTVDKAFEDMTNNFQRQSALPGFRAGKAPRHMVLQRYATDIEAEVKRKLIPDTYRQAIVNEKLRVLGYPDIEEIQFGRGKPLQFAATVEIAPDFEAPDFKNLTVKREARTVTDEDVDKALNTLRDQRVTFNDVARPAQAGDIVVVNYTGTSEGKPLTELAPTARGLTEQKNFWLEIKPGSFVPGFTEQLVGRSAGDKQTVNVTFPKDFVAATLSEKPGVYEVEVLQIKEKVLPALDEEFAKSFGAESLAKLREGVLTDLQNELAYTRDRNERNQIVESLLKAVSFELPESVVQAETRNVVHDMVRENQQRGVSREAIEQQKEQIYQFAASSAKERVKAVFVLNKIAEAEKITVNQQELAQRIYQLAEANQMPVEKFAKQLSERDGYSEIQQQLLTGKTLDHLQKLARIEEVPAGSLSVPAPQA